MADEAKREACLKAWHSRPQGELHFGFRQFERDFGVAWNAAVENERSRVVFGLRWFSDWLTDTGRETASDLVWDFAWWLQNPVFFRGDDGCPAIDGEPND